ncbi:MAG: hypothetical protein NTW61_06295 [Candidatus Melainabacteria bacterium]|jgi:hypothetical protein|nr:hypothetical protein [Candidatus Melainabacteria bacterium]
MNTQWKLFKDYIKKYSLPEALILKSIEDWTYVKARATNIILARLTFGWGIAFQTAGQRAIEMTSPTERRSVSIPHDVLAHALLRISQNPQAEYLGAVAQAVFSLVGNREPIPSSTAELLKNPKNGMRTTRSFIDIAGLITGVTQNPGDAKPLYSEAEFDPTLRQFSIIAKQLEQQLPPYDITVWDKDNPKALAAYIGKCRAITVPATLSYQSIRISLPPIGRL